MFSKIIVRKFEGEGHVKAFAEVTVADTIRVFGLKVVVGKNGPFLAMPQREKSEKEGENKGDKKSEKKYFDVCRLENKEDWKELERLILEEYHKAA